MRLKTALLTALVAATALMVTTSAQYSLTVNKDRLINAQNEPQNWLLMNGDYGSLRYSRLTQINRTNVKDLRMVWAMALGRHAGRRDRTGPRARSTRSSTTASCTRATAGARSTRSTRATRSAARSCGWPTRASSTKATPRARRGIALWENKVLANLPDGRVIAINRDNGEIVWDKKIMTKNEFGNQERFLTAPIVADGKVLVQNGAGDGGTRGWVAALDVNTGNELWRWYTVPKPGDPGSETWKDDHNAWKTGGGGIWQTGSYDAAQNLYIVGTGNPFPIYDPQFRPGDNLYTNSVVALDVATGKMKWHFQYTPNDSWDFDEAGVFMLYDQKIQGIDRKVVGHFARNGFFYSVDRTNGRFIKAEKYVNDLNWTKGIHPESGKPLDYNPKLDVQLYNPEARALRGDGRKRSCPTWHGGVAHQPMAYNPVKGIAYGVGTEGCFSQNGAAVASLGKDGGIDNKNSERRQFSSDLYYGAVTAFDTVNHKVVAKAVTDIEIRSGATVTAGGLVFTALQDGWVVAYNDETLEELWRFNVGTPLKGAPVTYAIGPKQFLAVQASGRHLHPVNFDKLENSSYLFVFALN